MAIAILAAAMAILGELGRLGIRNAKMAQDLTRAQLLCETKMAEYSSGISTPQTAEGSVFDSIYQDSNVEWIYSVEMQQIDQDGLIALKVTVSQNLPTAQRPATFSMVRWITDPSLSTSTESTEESGTGTSTTGTSNAQ